MLQTLLLHYQMERFSGHVLCPLMSSRLGRSHSIWKRHSDLACRPNSPRGVASPRLKSGHKTGGNPKGLVGLLIGVCEFRAPT